MLNTMEFPDQWRRPLLGVLLVSLASLLVFYSTWESIVAIWSRSETFTHGFLVAPASAGLIWLRRHDYRDLRPAFSLLGLGFVLLSGFIWLVADLVNVQVIRQWAVVGVLVSGFWAVLGTHTLSKMLFPVLFLFLMVPFGEAFIPPLMEYTATFVVTMLRLTGVSVYREGLFFTLTSGNWSVVEGCSGLRYLISSLTLGTVYAYLNYTSYKKRSVFILASFVVPILANGLRAYIIVMLGHLSGMKLAAGVDHIIYGWVFFGLVMFALFYVGSFWHDADQPDPKSTILPNAPDGAAAVYPHFWPIILGTSFCVLIWPTVSQALTTLQTAHVTVPELFSQPKVSGWQTTSDPDWGWQPNFNGVVADARIFMTDGQTIAGLYFANFGDESKGGELVNSQNYLIPQKHKVWRMTSDNVIPMQWPSGVTGEIEQSVLSSEQRDLLVLRWYRIGNKNTTNAYVAKAWQLFKRLSGDTSPELLMVLFTEAPRQSYDSANDKLKQLAGACCS